MSDDTITERRSSLADVRAWARRLGHEVGTRGHISQDLIDRYNRYHPDRPADNHNPMVVGQQ